MLGHEEERTMKRSKLAREMTIDVSQAPAERPRKRSRKAVALAAAGAVDLVQLALVPLFSEGIASPLEDALDVMTALLLVAILGFNWRLAVAFALELVPGASLFPSWTAAVLTMPAVRELRDEPVGTLEPLQPRG